MQLNSGIASMRTLPNMAIPLMINLKELIWKNDSVPKQKI